MKKKGIQIVTDLCSAEQVTMLCDLSIDLVTEPSGLILQGLVIGDTLHQNIALILSTHAAEWKEHPMLGIGIRDALLGEDLLAWRHEIRRQLESDGMKVYNLDFYNIDNLQIKADYV